MPFRDAPAGLRTLTARCLNFHRLRQTGQFAGDHETLRSWLNEKTDEEIISLHGIGARTRDAVLRWVRGDL